MSTYLVEHGELARSGRRGAPAAGSDNPGARGAAVRAPQRLARGVGA